MEIIPINNADVYLKFHIQNTFFKRDVLDKQSVISNSLKSVQLLKERNSILEIKLSVM